MIDFCSGMIYRTILVATLCALIPPAVAAAEKTLGVRTLTLDSARPGEWMLINTTTKPIAFRIGMDTMTIRVAPGTSGIHRISAKANKGAAVTAATPAGKEWEMFFSTYWPIYADKRCLVLFVADGDKIRVKRITDRIPAKKH